MGYIDSTESTNIYNPAHLSVNLADAPKLLGHLGSCSLGFCHTRVLLTN